MLNINGIETKEFSLPYTLIYSETKKAEKEGEKGSRVEIGRIEVKLPALADLGFDAEIEKDKEGKDKLDGDKLPIYKEEPARFLFDSIIAKSLAVLRARIVVTEEEIEGKTVKVLGWRDGEQEFTVSALMVEGEKGEWRKILSELKNEFKAFLGKTNLSDVVRNTYLSMMVTPEVSPGVCLANPKAREGFQRQTNAFIESLDESKTVRFAKLIQKAADAIPEPQKEGEVTAW